MDLTPWLDQLNAHLLAGLFLFVRISAMMFSMPMVGERTVPVPIKVGMSAATAMVLAPLAPAPESTDLVSVTLFIGKEALIGLVLGWISGLFFAAVQVAGEWLDLQGGFQAAQFINPAFNVHSAPLSNIKHILAGLIFFGGGGYALMLRALARSVEVVPCGSMGLSLGTPDHFTALLVEMFWLGIQIAAPLAGTLFLAEIGLALINKALPQMNAMFLALPAKGLLAVGAIALSLPIIAESMRNGVGVMGINLDAVLRVMGGG
jgi:flagellar biosynthetic protein FliR